ncbi:Regulatory CLIP domain of proteinase [Popillia japonica]|uniref:CLIP domain-containing serine protease n=1 Tax=Popillia japonica TaxID=7064 RepID=A0AAW1KPG1_POPJA
MRFYTVVIHVLFLYVRLLLHTASAQSNSEYCLTPHNTNGECILLARCPTIVQLLKKKPLLPEDAEYLRRSGCGFEGMDPKICCPLETGTTTSSITTNTPHEDTQQYGDLLPSLSHCGHNEVFRILGGELSDLGEFPWMALLEYQTRNGKGFYCGGVLINSRYVLTAAHCIKGKDIPPSWRLISVRLGEHNTSSTTDCIQQQGAPLCADPPVDVPIESQIAHEKYDPYDMNQYNDIGLLRLTQPVETTSYVQPVCIPRDDLLQQSFVGKNMTVAGWGKTESKSASDTLLKLQIQVRENSECMSTYKSVRVNINDVQLCAGGVRGQDSCRGDSGGPLMKTITVNGSMNYYVLGVVSFGPSPCGMEGWPGVYTRVTKYVPWIISKLKP